MDSTAGDTVVRIRGVIAQKVGPQRFNLWFKNSTRLALTDGYLEVGVPNPFIGGWIENHFTDQIAEAVWEVTGQNLQIAYSVNPSLMGNVRKSQLDGQARVVGKAPPRNAPRVERLGSSSPARTLRGRLKDFVIGSSNGMAYHAAQSVVDGEGCRYNPLFIHGGCGLGKTHLLQGIANGLLEKKATLKWAYLSGEEFTNEFLASLRRSRIDGFRNRLRPLDVLIIDDIHFLANKKATQEEFLHTFNAIDAAGKQVVMASDSHPKLIGQLSASLVSRFVSGMVVRIDPPEFETRCEILRRRAAQMNRQIPKAVIEYIAENLETNVRELEGALLKLAAFSNVIGQSVSMGMARQALADHFHRSRPLVQLSDIESVTATFFGLSPADLHTSRKTRTIALARAIAMFLARKHTEMSFPEIGRFMGNKNHSTVILACKRIASTLGQEGTVCWRTPTGKSEMALSVLLAKLEEQLAR